MYWVITLSVILTLIALNALYVAAEFSTVSARKARLAQMADGGNIVAERMLKVVEDPRSLDTYVATCQVGITLSSLVLGYYGQSRLTGFIAPMVGDIGGVSTFAAESISATVILVVLSIFQIVLGELVPKNVGIQFPERLATMTATPMRWSENFFKPLIWLFNGSGVLLMRIFRLNTNTEHTHVHSPEEIVYLIDESSAGGEINPEERLLLRNTLQMRETMIRQLMIPRARMLAAPNTLTTNQLLKLVSESPYSRVPVFDKTIDNILGVVHLRDLLCLQINGDSAPIETTIRPVPFVPESMQVKEVFSLLQKKHFQVAIVLDEYGGTAGMVTLEDLLEEIFGDLQDEFDDSSPSYQIRPNNRIWIQGDMLLQQFNRLFPFDLPDNEFDTIGGMILNIIGHVPIVSDEISIGDHQFRVEKMSGRGVAMISFEAPDQLIDELKEGTSQ